MFGYFKLIEILVLVSICLSTPVHLAYPRNSLLRLSKENLF